MYTEIIKIIEGGMVGNRTKVHDYALVLAGNLEESGDTDIAEEIYKVLTWQKSKMATLDGFVARPTDKESRMEMVDVSYPSFDTGRPILRDYIEDEIREFVASYQHREVFFKAGIRNANTLLLYGPPGCGKTTVARYVSFIAELPLVTARLDGLVSSLLGSTAKNIRRIFDYVSQGECILFIDEFDAVAKIRDDNHELGELKRVVNSLLQNIDGFSANSILIAATNHSNLLDPAVWRRFNKIIALDKPNESEIKILLERFLQPVESNTMTNKRKMNKVAAALVGMSHGDIETIVQNSIKRAIINGRNLVDNWELLGEIYLYKNHRIVNDGDFISFLLAHGAVQREINKGFGYSLRKIREESAKNG
ncbi:MAG: ATP-binding protein [Firmicutes bacterium]|nr:ATP-binding protein [Bacillota bacterium]